MPVTYQIDGRLVRLICVGSYAPRDLRQIFLAALADPEFPQDAAFVLDVTQSESLQQRTTDEIRATAYFLEPHVDKIGGRCAIVATSDVHYGLSRMGAVFSEDIGAEVQVFRSLDEAYAWIGVSNE